MSVKRRATARRPSPKLRPIPGGSFPRGLGVDEETLERWARHGLIRFAGFPSVERVTYQHLPETVTS